MSELPNTPPASTLEVDQKLKVNNPECIKDASSLSSFPAPDIVNHRSIQLEGPQSSDIKPLPTSSRSETDSGRSDNAEHVPCRRSSCPASKHHDSTLANNVELFLKKRRELLCLSDSNVTRTSGDSYDTWWQGHSSSENETRRGLITNIKRGLVEPHVDNRGRQLNQDRDVALTETAARKDSASSHSSLCLSALPCNSPARFLECCLAAESGAKDLFTCRCLKDGCNEQFKGLSTNKHEDCSADESLSTSEAGLVLSPRVCKGACSACCSMKYVVEGSLKNKRNQKNTCSDVKTSDSGIHTEADCCRICQEDGTYEKLISPCYCSGTVGYMHLSCLETWLGLNGRTACELCLFPFPVVKIRPTIWQFFSRPLANMDFASLLCDIACFCVLTPLLIASTYLCSIGVSHYEEVGKTGSVFAIVTLMVSLIAVYISWAVLAILYHRRVFLTWREKTARIQMWTDKNSPDGPKKLSEDVNGVNRDCNPVNVPNASHTSRSLLLKPMLWYSYRFRSQRTESRLAFGQDFNSNRIKEHVMLKRIHEQRQAADMRSSVAMATEASTSSAAANIV
ncbi:hypothetical protein Btru_027512 [Bulinus truncatus]|nr:hypothetical protein Btru_027512 [Bulinus truncatus]